MVDDARPASSPAHKPRRRANSVQNASTRATFNRSRCIPDASPGSTPVASSAPAPARPKRNPARLAVLVDAGAGAAGGRVARTGAPEEITPWELEPPPPAESPEHPHQPARTLSSFVRRRKSTGPKPLSRPGPGAPGRTRTPPPPLIIPKHHHNPRPKHASSVVLQELTRSNHQHAKRPPALSSSNSTSSATITPSRPPLHTRASVSDLRRPSAAVLAARKKKDQAGPRPAFSTADRTILEELKRSILAREAQFILKPSFAAAHLHPHLSLSAGASAGHKHHPYPPHIVPYPASYHRTHTVDCDVWESVFCRLLCHSLTWHVFSAPSDDGGDHHHPTATAGWRVLDLGCGAGTWILDCAREWRECTFVGLDIVPLHPDLVRVGLGELAQRITWVQHNFLDGLPFPNDEFDYVHIKRIARGVPEDKWDSLLEEIARVMKPGAAFEMIEEDLFFPGEQWAEGEGQESSDDAADDDDDEQLYDSDPSAMSSASLTHPPSSTPSLPSPRPSSPQPLSATISEEADEEEDDDDDEHAHQTPQLSATNLVSTTTTNSGAADNNNHKPHQTPKLLSTISPLNLLTSMGIIYPPPPTMTTPLLGLTSVLALQQSPPPRTSSSPQPLSATFSDAADEGDEGVKCYHHQQLPPPPKNPRDHTLLSTIYTEMHSSRFINLTPLSLLANSLGIYFKDVRTHPPLRFAFPPKLGPVVPDDSQSGHSSVPPMENGSEPDDEQGGVSPRATAAVVSDDDEEDDPERGRRFISMRGLMKRESPYISIDGSRMSAYSPSARASSIISSPTRSHHPHPPPPVPSSDSSDPTRVVGPNASHHHHDPIAAVKHATQTRSRLPNETLHFDIGSLGLHLALRVSEVLACAEAMWEWIEQYQGEERVRDEKKKALMEEELNKVAGGGGGRMQRQRVRSGSLSAILDSGQTTNRPLSMAVNPVRSLPVPATQSSDGGGEGGGAPPQGNSVASQMKTIKTMTREEFDELLYNFDLDMREQMMLSTALEDRFDWRVPLPSVQSATGDREAFDKACVQWDEHVRVQRLKKRQMRMEMQQQQARLQPQNNSAHPYGAARKQKGRSRRPGTAEAGGMASSSAGITADLASSGYTRARAASQTALSSSSSAAAAANTRYHAMSSGVGFSSHPHPAGSASASAESSSPKIPMAVPAVASLVPPAAPAPTASAAATAKSPKKPKSKTEKVRLSRAMRVFVAWKAQDEA